MVLSDRFRKSFQLLMLGDLVSHFELVERAFVLVLLSYRLAAAAASDFNFNLTGPLTLHQMSTCSTESMNQIVSVPLSWPPFTIRSCRYVQFSLIISLLAIT